MMSREDSEGQNNEVMSCELSESKSFLHCLRILPETFADSQTSKIELRNSANFS